MVVVEDACPLGVQVNEDHHMSAAFHGDATPSTRFNSPFQKGEIILSSGICVTYSLFVELGG